MFIVCRKVVITINIIISKMSDRNRKNMYLHNFIYDRINIIYKATLFIDSIKNGISTFL